MPAESNEPRSELPPDAGVEDIQRDIEQTRQELGETVNALSAKADVTGRVKNKVSETQAEIADRAHAAQATVRHAVTDDSGAVKRSVPVGALIVGIAVLGVLLWRRRR